jgi:hypothetical protein
MDLEHAILSNKLYLKYGYNMVITSYGSLALWLFMVMVTTRGITIFNHVPRYGTSRKLCKDRVRKRRRRERKCS